MEHQITECHVTLKSTGHGATSTFVLSNWMQMNTCMHLIQSYIAERKVFTVSYS